MPPQIGRVLNLVHTLIAYGKTFADTLQQRAAGPHPLPRLAFLTTAFGTTDLARILARITRGLLRAAALEARLRRRAARGRDLQSTPRRPPSPRQPRAATPAQAPAPDRPPTPEEIEAEVRRRPIGAVLVDICLDLGIMPGQMDRAMWDELSLVLIGHGGSLAKLVCRRERNRRHAELDADSPADPTASPTPAAGGRDIHIAYETIASPQWPVRFPHPAHVPEPVPGIGRPVPACTGPP